MGSDKKKKKKKDHKSWTHTSNKRQKTSSSSPPLPRQEEEEASAQKRLPNAATSLTASIFASSTSAHEEALSSSISKTLSSSSSSPFQTNNNNNNSSLFGSREKYQSVSRQRQLQIQSKQQRAKTPEGTNSTCTNSGNNDRESILQRRQEQTASTRQLVESISVEIPSLSNNGDDNSDNDEELQEGILRLFAGQASSVLLQQGVVILKQSSSSSSPSNNATTKTCSTKLLKKLRSKMKEIEHEICTRLDQAVGKHYRVASSSSLPVSDNHHDSEQEKDYTFRYQEVASRCLGRLDIRHGMDRPPFTHAGVLQNPYLLSLVHKLLGKDAVLVYAGLILSFANSANQPWHQDGPMLFPELMMQQQQAGTPLQLPPYALNIFVPVCEITETLGPTEFILQSQHACSLDDEHIKDKKIIGPLLQAGDALIYDYRTCHRGTSNLSSTSTTRPMLYLMYARPWFKEHLNFGTEKLFPE